MRVGLLDIVAAGVLAVAVLLPSPTRTARALYFPSEARAFTVPIAIAQAEARARPSDAAAAARLSELLVSVRQTDWAVGAAAAGVGAAKPDRWRALVAVSAAHSSRFELTSALEWAEKAVAACEEPGADCAEFEHARLGLYARALEAAIASGIDPRRSPDRLEEAVRAAVRLIRLRDEK